jgi:hypothetical protein
MDGSGLGDRGFRKICDEPCTNPVTQCVRELRRFVGRPCRTSGRFRSARCVIGRGPGGSLGGSILVPVTRPIEIASSLYSSQ